MENPVHWGFSRRLVLSLVLVASVLGPGFRSAVAQNPVLIGILRESAAGTNKHVVGIQPSTAALTDLATEVITAGNAFNTSYSAADNKVYGLMTTPAGSHIFTYDIGTQIASLSPVISASAGGLNGIDILKVHRTTGVLYAIIRDGSNNRFIGSVNPSTGVVTPFGPGFTASGFTYPTTADIDADANEFIFIASTGGVPSYYRVSTSTGSATIAAVSGTQPYALGHDPSTATLYGFTGFGGSGQLYSINPATGVSTTIGSSFPLATWDQVFTIDPVNGEAYISGRVLTMGSSERAIFTINLGTGVASQSPNMDLAGFSPALTTGYNGFVATASSPPPEITRVSREPDGSIRIEFQTQAGKSYRVFYSQQPDVVTSYSTAQFPGGQAQKMATSNQLDWTDSGPPATISHPSVTERRFYTVQEQ